VIENRVALGRSITGAFARDDVQELRPLELRHVLKRYHERVEIVTVDRPM